MKYQTFELDFYQFDKVSPEDKIKIAKLNPADKLAKELEQQGYEFFFSESQYAGIPAAVSITAKEDGSHIKDFRSMTDRLGIKYTKSYAFVGPWKA